MSLRRNGVIIVFICFCFIFTSCKSHEPHSLPTNEPEQTPAVSAVTDTPPPSPSPSPTPAGSRETAAPEGFSPEFQGTWYSDTYQRVTISDGVEGFTGAVMKLDLDKNRISGKMFLAFVSNPPASRVATLNTTIHFVSQNKGEFVFDDDDWGHSGSGTIEMRADHSLYVTITLSKVPTSNWGILFDHLGFSKEKPNAIFHNEDEATATPAASASPTPSVPPVHDLHTATFQVGEYQTTLQIPADWDGKYMTEEETTSCLVYYRSKTMGPFMLFELLEMPDTEWAKISSVPFESGNDYVLMKSQGGTSFIYRTHNDDMGDVEEEFFTFRGQFQQELAKTFDILPTKGKD